jgi:DNA-binding SARP family transcriptional activator/Flp pilus assembly protein TadD
VELRVLGHLEVRHNGVPVSLGPQVRVVLGVLIAAGSQPVSVSTMIDRLWVGDDPPTAETVRSHVAHLRKILRRLGPEAENLVVTDNAGYLVRPAPDQLDADRFKKLYAQGIKALRDGEPDSASQLLREALELWRGPVLADLAGHSFVASYAQPLEAMRAAAQVARIEADLGLGRHREVVDELRQLMDAAPTNEHLLRLLALAVYRSHGAEPAATVCREGLERLLERGIEAPDLTDLQRRILQRTPDLDWRRPESVFDVPEGGRIFTGRTDMLEAMRVVLGQVTTGVRAIALHGLGGVGKSRLALEYAHRHADEYDIAYLIDADQPTAIAARLAELAQRLGAAPNPRHDVMLVALWQLLRTRSRWLLIYDDAPDPQSLANLWPRGGNGQVIVTSRNPAWGGRAAPLPVDVLQRRHSTQFIAERLSLLDIPPEADALADELGDLPLALEQACAFIEQTKVTIAAYLDLLRRHGPELLEYGDATGATTKVATAWSVSLRHLREQEPAAEQLLNLCAFLSPLGIPRALFSKHASELPTPLGQEVTNPIRYLAVVGTLGRYSLATVTDEELALHPLVQKVVRDKLAPDVARECAGHAVRLVDAALSTDPAAASWPLLRHALTATEHAQSADVEPSATASVLAKAARSQVHVGDLYTGAALLEKALKIREVVSGPGSRTVSDILIRLGRTQRELGDLAQAQSCFRRAAEIRQSEYGPDSPAMVDALDGLGIVLFDLGEMEAARRSLADCLAIREMHPELDELALAVTYSVHGLVLWSLNELPTASTVLERAYNIRVQRYGPEHHDVATSLDNWAKVVFDMGHLERAKTMNERALQIRKDRLGDDHYHVAVSLNHYGYVLRELGDLDGALDAHEQAAGIFKGQLGPRHTHVARSLVGKGKVLILTSDHSGAQAAFEEALEIFGAVLGLAHTETALCLAELGQARFLLGDRMAARPEVRQAVDIVGARRPATHPDLVRIREMLATIDGSTA